MRYFSTPQAPCQAICPTCAENAAGETFQDWCELDPETLESARPTHCARCGEPSEVL